MSDSDEDLTFLEASPAPAAKPETKRQRTEALPSSNSGEPAANWQWRNGGAVAGPSGGAAQAAQQNQPQLHWGPQAGPSAQIQAPQLQGVAQAAMPRTWHGAGIPMAHLSSSAMPGGNPHFAQSANGAPQHPPGLPNSASGGQGFTPEQLQRLRNQVLSFRDQRIALHNIQEVQRVLAAGYVFPTFDTGRPFSQQQAPGAQNGGGPSSQPAAAGCSDGLPEGEPEEEQEEPEEAKEPAKPSPRPFLDEDGEEYLKDLPADEDAQLLAVMEGLEQQEGLVESESPAGLRVTLHPYQRKSLTWMKLREDAGEGKVQGGILADEQGLGKTVQMLSLIVSNVPSRENAAKALKKCGQEEKGVEFHPLGRTARDHRAAAEAARLNAGAGPATPNTAGTPTPGESGSKKAGKPKPKPIRWQPCSNGQKRHCTCAICNKAREQQRAEDARLAKRQEAARREARRREKEALKSPATPCPRLATPLPPRVEALLQPTVESPDGGVVKRTLVVCPKSVALQWKDEVEAKTPQLRVALYHGPDRLARFPTPSLLASYDVVVSTYDILTQDSKQSPVGPIFRVPWFRVILDEAHIIRNRSTKGCTATLMLKSERRWCLSGTPFVNYADDVLALFQFLDHRPFSEPAWFNSHVQDRVYGKRVRGRARIGTSVESRRAGYEKLKIAMSAVSLRRRLSDKDANGRPIVQLPPVTRTVVERPMSSDESAFYRGLETQSVDRFHAYVRKGFSQNYANILVLLLRLRQACIHPYLAQTPGGEPPELSDDEDTEEGSEEGKGKQGLEPVGDGMDIGLKLKLYRKIVKDTAECPICLDMVEEPLVTRCCHGPFCKECIHNVLQQQTGGEEAGRGKCPLCRHILGPADLFDRSFFVPPKPKAMEGEDGEDVHDRGVLEILSSTKLNSVIEVLNQYRREDQERWEGEEAGVSKSAPTKACVFSQFTKSLDMMEHELAASGIQCVRLDGSMDLSDRAVAVRAFATDPAVRVMLCSMRATSLGLNLTMACKVIFLDFWWNASSEDQAVSRCHRLGQSREVGVVKIVMRLDDGGETVEHRIIRMQEDKRALAESALGDTDAVAGTPTRLSLEDLKQLFGVGKSRRTQPAVQSSQFGSDLAASFTIDSGRRGR